MRHNPSEVRRRRTGLRVATLLACVALLVAVGVLTSALIREPAPARVTPIDLPSGAGVPTATPTPSGGFEPPSADDDPDDDPFDDDD